MMYRIRWEIDLDADDPKEAAKRAQEYMDSGDAKWCFDIWELGTQDDEEPTVIDLLYETDRQE